MTKQIVTKLFDRLLDWKYGIRTTGSDLNSEGRAYKEKTGGGGHAYATISYRILLIILKRLELQPTDVFVDIGCGKGRVLACAASERVSEVIGVDIDADLCEVARANMVRLRMSTPRRIVNCGAEDFSYSDCTCFWLYNPFGPALLEKVMGQIFSSLADNPRKIKIVYVVPKFTEVLESLDWLRCYESWTPGDANGAPFRVSFWRNDT